jgi:hypothetical protein
MYLCVCIHACIDAYTYARMYIVNPAFNETASDGNFFSAPERFRLIQVCEFWFLGPLKFLPYRQVAVMPKFRLIQVFIYI